MRRSSLVFLGLLVAAVAELAVLTLVGRAIGVWPLLLILIAEGVLGTWLVRREGAKAWASLRDAQRDPAKSGPALTDAALVLLGAILLILPGFVSDAVGAFFLLPLTRPLARRSVTGVFRLATRRYRDQADLLSAKLDRSTVVEGQTVEQQPPRPPSDGPDDGIVIRGEIVP